jgi:parvulin-like peptidyl-prolyl isomerase
MIDMPRSFSFDVERQRRFRAVLDGRTRRFDTRGLTMKRSTIQTAILIPLGSILAGMVLVGCKAGPSSTGGETPGVVTPSRTSDRASGNDVAGSASASGPRSADRVLAEVQGVKVTEGQLLPVLYGGPGLDVLMKVVQMNLAVELAARSGVTISPADVQAERSLTLSLAFPDQDPEDYEQLLSQWLQQQRVTPPEFDVLMRTNAALRAIVKGAAAEVTDQAVRNEFNSLYGERVRVRHIAVSNLQEVAEVQRRLRGDPSALPPVPPQPFEAVARAMSQNRVTAPQGGEMPPFALNTGGISPVFAQAAFALRPGEVSTDAVQDRGFYHIIKCDERIAPTAVKFEDVRESVRQELIRLREANLMSLKRQELAQVAVRTIQINEPTLKKQYEERVAAATPKPAEREEVRRNLDEQRQRLNEPATQSAAPAQAATPAAVPAAVPVAPPVAAPAPSVQAPSTQPTRAPESAPAPAPATQP